MADIGRPPELTSQSNNVQREHIGLTKSLVFYKGKSPKSVETNWIMQESAVKDPPRNKKDANDIKVCSIFSSFHCSSINYFPLSYIVVRFQISL